MIILSDRVEHVAGVVTYSFSLFIFLGAPLSPLSRPASICHIESSFEASKVAAVAVGGGLSGTGAGLLAGSEIIGVSEMGLDITRFVRCGIQSHWGMFSSSRKSPLWSAHK